MGNNYKVLLVAEVDQQISSQITAYNGIGEFYQQRKDGSKVLVSLSCSRGYKNESFVNVFVVNEITSRQQ